jgi:hypothetical protein
VPTIPPDTRLPGDSGHVTDHNAISDVLTAHATAIAAVTLTPTAVKTSAYTAAPSDLVPVDTTSGNVTITLPSAPADKTLVAVKQVTQGTGKTATVACGGTDVFNKTGGGTSLTLSLTAQGAIFQYQASGGIWFITSDDLPLSQLDTRYTSVYNVKSPLYGAKGDGTTDDTAAIQAAINAITGTAAPASNTRLAKGVLYFPAGTYKVTSDLVIRSVQDFVLVGDGPGQVQIMPSGTGFTTAVLLIDGSLDGIFGGFAIQGDGTEQVTDAIRLDWTTAAFRSTTGNTFRDIRIKSTKFVTGISLESNATRQLDGTTLRNVVVYGGQTAGSWSSSGNWQKAVAYGSGSFGNIYDQQLLGVDTGQCYYGHYCNASGFALYGGQCLGNAVDFFIIPAAQTTISNVQSQNSGQFIVQTSAFSPYPVTVNSALFVTSYLDSSNNVVDIYGGVWHISNLDVSKTQRSGSYVGAVINIRGAGANRPGVVLLDNVSSKSAVGSGIAVTASEASVVARNYSQYDPSTGNYTVTTSQFYNGTSWITPGSTTAPDIQYFTTVGTATWTKPSGAVTTDVILMSGGAGGGSGRRGAAGTVRCGGGGGAGATLVQRRFASADLASSVTVTVGDGGAGGAAVTADSTNGNAGSLSGSSSFGTYLAGPLSTGGAGGTASAGTGGSGSLGGAGTGGAGANASTTGGAGVSVNPGILGATGGPSGGGITSGDVAGAGAVGAYSYMGGTSSSTFGAAGAVDSTSPTSGTSSGVKGTPGGSPGSGAASITTAAQAGASAYANSGAGGAGGGASLNGNNSGAGGKGGSGFVLVVTFFQ